MTPPFCCPSLQNPDRPICWEVGFLPGYSGVLKAGSYVYNATTGRKERIGRILQMHANHREDREAVYSGEIAAAVGLKNTTTGDTLTDESALFCESQGSLRR